MNDASHIHGPIRRAILVATLVGVAWNSPARAGETEMDRHAPSRPSGLLGRISAAPDELLFDEPGDGALWVRGASYKARFDGGGATVIPFFGSNAPRNYPVELRPVSAEIGGRVLEVASASKAMRDGERVHIDHGSFVEQYDLALTSLEQRFVFESLPNRGRLVLELDATSELTGSDLGASLRFENELGYVEYGEAFAIDAAGRRVALESTLDTDSIRIVVPESFLADATLPLTIDPLVTFFTVSGATYSPFTGPDVAYDATSDRWCVCYTDAFSLVDEDAYATLVSSAGAVISTVTIDSTLTRWRDIHVANNRAWGRFMVVAEVALSAGLTSIRGRVVTAATAAVGAVVQVSPLDGAARTKPDVGGDAVPSGPFTYFCVVWQRAVSASDSNIEMQLFEPDGVLFGGLGVLDGSTNQDTSPSISKSTECFDTLLASWTVVWERRLPSSMHSICGARINYDGSFSGLSFVIDAGSPGSSAFDNLNPDVSTMLDLPSFGGVAKYLVVYERHTGFDRDILGVVMQGTSVLTSRGLSADYPATLFNLQTAPTVDSDGSHFFVGWSETVGVIATDKSVFVSDYFLSGSDLVPCQVHGDLASTPMVDDSMSVASMASAGGPKSQYLGAYLTDAGIAGFWNIRAATWGGCASGGTATAYCLGDGSGTACPCGNVGSAGSGCANSTSSAGARLTGSGSIAVSADTFHLLGQGMPPTSPCLYFQGTTSSGNGVAFGDGLLCLGGTVTRLGIVSNSSAGTSGFPTGGHLSTLGGVPVAGGLREYQIWYRDAVTFCTASTFNLTNGLLVAWSQ